jgi:hypothetical protein
VGKKEDGYTVLSVKLGGKRALGRPSGRWEDIGTDPI